MKASEIFVHPREGSSLIHIINARGTFFGLRMQLLGGKEQPRIWLTRKIADVERRKGEVGCAKGQRTNERVSFEKIPAKRERNPHLA